MSGAGLTLTGTGGRGLVANAPAKVNMCLFVGPTRSDGRHELVTVMQALGLADEVRLLPAARDASTDEVECPGVDGPNLAASALAAFRAATGWDAGPLRVEINKRVPVAAGMGGGSSDAATVLRLCMRASGLGDEALLREIAAGLGSDVPGLVAPGRVLARGAGERLDRLPDPPMFGLVVLPSAARLSTGAVYAEADRLGSVRTAEDLEDVLGRVHAGVLEVEDPLSHWLIHNDLQDAALGLEPSCEEALAAAREAGAYPVMVSGSGPTVVGFFLGPTACADAGLAAAALRERFPGALATAPVTERFGEPREL